MTNRERFCAVLNHQPVDRLPVIEWAPWWNLTTNEWKEQGAPVENLFPYYGLDDFRSISIDCKGTGFPSPRSEGHGVLSTMEEYEQLLAKIHTDECIENTVRQAKTLQEGHERGDFPIWAVFEGFFWFPRTMFGIEDHLYAFFDEPELMHRLNREHAEFGIRAFERVCKVLKPDFMTFAEDMSYNHGSMISKELYDEFMRPYYNMVIPVLKANGIKVFIDTDGDVEPLVPWFEEAGIEGVLPLERQAGVDVNRIRREHPDWLMIGGYDKTIMHLGEAAMRTEFERVLPAMRSGGYIPSVDHQTPPDVTVEQYHCYVKLLKEYAQKCVR